MPGHKHLLALVGATATGKTEVAIALAQHFRTEIISADSRQFFREMTIGVAAPTDKQLATVPHHFVKSRSVAEPYSAGQFAEDVLRFLSGFFKRSNLAILTGGSGLYVKAVCDGFDDVPPSDPEVREELNQRLRREGLEPLLRDLATVDAEYYSAVDRANPRRVLRALEVWQITGKPFSSFRRTQPRPRPFQVLRIGLTCPQEELKERIHQRVDDMMTQGLLDEVRSLMPFRHLPALQSVGYRELFAHLDGGISLDDAIALIKRNTMQFAKRQMTWWRKELPAGQAGRSIEWFQPTQVSDIVSRVESWLGSSKASRP